METACHRTRCDRVLESDAVLCFFHIRQHRGDIWSPDSRLILRCVTAGVPGANRHRRFRLELFAMLFPCQSECLNSRVDDDRSPAHIRRYAHALE
jgi:hypothetical protein